MKPLVDHMFVGRKAQKSSFALLAAISQDSTCHLCVLGPSVGLHRAMALIGDTKQAKSEGKSGPIETGLTRPAATALLLVVLSNIRWLSTQPY